MTDLRGVNHFRRLLGRKNAIAYVYQRVGDEDVRDLVDKAEKFSAWAYTYFKEILGEKINS